MRSPIPCGFFSAFERLRIEQGADPHIDKIEPYREGTNKVAYTIHFTNEMNRTYIVQYTTSLRAGTNGLPHTNWTDIFTTFSVPFELHYIFKDLGARTNQQRFYRLAATP